MNKNTLESVLKWLIYGTFFVPLVFIPSSYIFPFIVPKIIYFRTLSEIMVASYVLLLAINFKEYAPKNTWLNYALLAFIISFSLSTFLGVDAYHSFWDNHERMLGLFTLLHYIAFYFVSQAAFRDFSDWKLAGRIFLFAGSIVMFIGWLQTQNPNLLMNQGSERVLSTLGNPIYVGGYGLFLLFLSLLLSKKEKKGSSWQWFYLVTGFFGFMGILWSGTRGAVLGLAAAAVFAVLSYIVVLKNYPKVRYSLLGLAVVGLIAVLSLYHFRQTDFVKNIPAVGRTVNTSLEDVKNSPRWIAWDIAWQSFKEKPVFGWGPNNYFFAFNAHYNPRSLEFGYGETWFDNAHNIVMNTLAVQGIFGLITLLGVYFVALFSLVRGYRANKFDYHFMIIAGAFLVAHFVSTITVFEDPTSYIYLMFWFAMVSSLSFVPTKEDLKAMADKKLTSGYMSATAVVLLLFIFIFNVQPARANQTTLVAIRNLSGGIKGLGSAEEALNFNSPHIDDIRSDVARSISQVAASDDMPKDQAKQLLDLAINGLEKNLDLHPLDIRNQLSLSQLYQSKAQITGDARYLQSSEILLKDALEKSPKRQQLVYSLTAIQLETGRTAEATKLLEKTLEENPNISETYWRLAYIYRLAGQVEKADQILKYATDNSVKFSDKDQQVLKLIEGVSGTKK